MALQELLYQALNAQRSGNLTQADRLYRAVLAIEPRNFDANHLIGVMRFQQGRVTEALSFLDTALQTAPDAVEALTHHGLEDEQAHGSVAAGDKYVDARVIESTQKR